MKVLWVKATAPGKEAANFPIISFACHRVRACVLVGASEAVRHTHALDTALVSDVTVSTLSALTKR